MEGFGEAAERYCDAVDSALGTKRATLLARLTTALTRLYDAGAAIPDVDPDTDSIVVRMGTGEWSGVQESLAHALGGTAETAAVADELANIYRAVCEGLSVAHSGASAADVLWHWRESFVNGWEPEAADALVRLRALATPDTTP